MKSELLALAFGDLHLNEWKQFNEDHTRLYAGVDVLSYMNNLAQKKKVPLLFTGDLIHTDQHITNRLLQESLPILKNMVNFYGIDGNHDQSEQNTNEYHSPSYFNTFSQVFEGIHCLNFKTVELDKIVLHGIPYLTNNIGLKEAIADFKIIKGKKNILLIHTDLHGAEDNNGMVIDSTSNIPKDMDKFFSKFDLTLAGHIHKPQCLGDNIYMLGAPQQQRRTDKGSELGFWKVYANKVTFTPFNKYPEFKDYEGEEKPDDFNFWTKLPKKQKTEDNDYNFSAKIDKGKLASRYCKTKGISDKKKIRALKKQLEDL